MPDLSALIERLEGATGPDREIDRELMFLTHKQVRRHIGGECDCCPDGKHLDLVWVDLATDKWVTTARDGFNLTASIDAALAFAKRFGFYVRLEPRFHIDGERVDFISYAIRPRWADYTPRDDWFDVGEGRHADQALAILIAALKALQERNEGSSSRDQNNRSVVDAGPLPRAIKGDN